MRGISSCSIASASRRHPPADRGSARDARAAFELPRERNRGSACTPLRRTTRFPVRYESVVMPDPRYMDVWVDVIRPLITGGFQFDAGSRIGDEDDRFDGAGESLRDATCVSRHSQQCYENVAPCWWRLSSEASNSRAFLRINSGARAICEGIGVAVSRPNCPSLELSSGDGSRLLPRSHESGAKGSRNAT